MPIDDQLAIVGCELIAHEDPNHEEGTENDR